MIDEVQRGGDPLILAIKADVDRHGFDNGRYVLAGSSRFLTIPTISESLAGRARIVELWPLTQDEIGATCSTFVDTLFGATPDLRLQELLRVLPWCLRPGGRAAIISFHSGEDRLVKAAFKEGLRTGLYARISDDPLRPTFGERTENPRARSAKLRWAVRSL
jgi:predicted AAA+ superfamily ATPase